MRLGLRLEPRVVIFSARKRSRHRARIEVLEAMKRFPLLLSAAAVLAASSVQAEQPANPNAEEAKALIKEFATTLQGELQSAMKAGGPTKAIGVCSDRAPAIAADLSARSGWDVGRTSLRVRNLAMNLPDGWELGVLEAFEDRKAAGESVDSMAFAEVVETEGGTQFRFMKAIPTGEVCLACHGSEITAEVAAALDEQYPGDQARGFALGDIRGAFSLSKPL
jgi:hypothetical protein